MVFFGSAGIFWTQSHASTSTNDRVLSAWADIMVLIVSGEALLLGDIDEIINTMH